MYLSQRRKDRFQSGPMQTSERLRLIAQQLCELADDLDVEAKIGGRKLEDLNWSMYCQRMFQREGIQTIGQLIRRSEFDLRTIPNIGHKSVREIREKLREPGLALRP